MFDYDNFFLGFLINRGQTKKQFETSFENIYQFKVKKKYLFKFMNKKGRSKMRSFKKKIISYHFLLRNKILNGLNSCVWEENL